MRIAMVTSWDRHCGIYTYSRPLVEEMRRQGHDVQVIAHSDATPSETVHPVIDLSRPDWYIALERKVAELKPDVVHLQFEYGLYAHRRHGESLDLAPRMPLHWLYRFFDGKCRGSLPL